MNNCYASQPRKHKVFGHENCVCNSGMIYIGADNASMNEFHALRQYANPLNDFMPNRYAFGIGGPYSIALDPSDILNEFVRMSEEIQYLRSELSDILRTVSD